MSRVKTASLAILLAAFFPQLTAIRRQGPSGSFHPAIPKTRDDGAMATLESPAARSAPFNNTTSTEIRYRLQQAISWRLLC
jgi:hypothetical protein